MHATTRMYKILSDYTLMRNKQKTENCSQLFS
jgi:hypothetical protein